jgi:hypothetical protein
MPLPSLHDVIISSEILFILWPLRWLQRYVEDDLTKQRRLIIQKHYRHHKGKLQSCSKENCSLLTEALPADHF